MTDHHQDNTPTDPTVISCDGFAVPITTPLALGVTRTDSGRFAVIVEHDGEEVPLAHLDSFRDALDASKAVAMLARVLFPHPSTGDGGAL